MRVHRKALGIFIISGIVCLSYSQLIFARDSIPLHLKVQPDFFSKTCPGPLWQNTEINFNKIEDKRPDKILGVVTKRKGKDPVDVISQPPLVEVISKNIIALFNYCGMKITKDDLKAKNQLSVEINEFIAMEEKRFITGKGHAKSRITLTVQQPQKKTAASVGYEMEFKLTRKRGIERLTEILNELLGNTLKQIPKSPQLSQL